MRTLIQEIEDWTARGVVFTVSGERLRYRAPEGVITTQDLEVITSRKEEIIEAVRANLPPVLPPVVEYNDISGIPLSEIQKIIWQQLEQGTRANFVLCKAVMINEDVDIPAMRRALNIVWARHSALRTQFYEELGVVRQRVVSSSEMPLELEDLGVVSSTEFANRMRRFAADVAETHSHRAERLAGGYIMLRRNGPSIFSIAVNHLVSDVISMGIVMSEVLTLYEELSSGGLGESLGPVLQFKDYAMWEQTLPAAVGDYYENWWRRRVKDKSSRGLHGDLLPPQQRKFIAGMEPIHISQGIAKEINAYVKQSGLTMFAAMAAIFGAALAADGHEGNIEISTVVSGRLLPETVGSVGFYARGFPISIEVNEDKDFVTLIKAAQQDVATVIEHQWIPADFIGRVQGMPAKIWATINYIEVAGSEGMFKPLAIDSYRENDVTADNVALTLGYTESGLVGSLVYPAELFSRDRMAALGSSIVEIAEQWIGSPGAPFSELALKRSVPAA